MPVELNEGDEIICPLCREETVVFQRNKKMRPYFLCRTLQSPVNLNAPINVSEGFLKQFVAEGEGDEIEAPTTVRQAKTLDDLDDE